MLRRLTRCFAELTDPAKLERQISISKYSGSALNLYMQSDSFEMQRHAGVMLASLHRCKVLLRQYRCTKEPETYDNLSPKRLLIDARYQSFLRKLVGEIDDVKVYNQLAWLYLDGEASFPPEVEDKVNKLIKAALAAGSLDDLMTSASTVALAMQSQKELVKAIAAQVTSKSDALNSVPAETLASFIQALAKL
jgi:hypothetical protein